MGAPRYQCAPKPGPVLAFQLGEIVSGSELARVADQELTHFGSTPTGPQDAAATIAVYHRGAEEGRGTRYRFA